MKAETPSISIKAKKGIHPKSLELIAASLLAINIPTGEADNVQNNGWSGDVVVLRLMCGRGFGLGYF